MPAFEVECDCGWKWLAITQTDAQQKKQKHLNDNKDDNGYHNVYISIQ